MTSLRARATEDDAFNAELCLQFGSEVATMQLLLLRVGDAAKELQEAGGATHVRAHMQKVFDDKATKPLTLWFDTCCKFVGKPDPFA